MRFRPSALVLLCSLTIPVLAQGRNQNLSPAEQAKI